MLLAPGLANAQVSDGAVKIGVLNDMSSLYADIAGPGSLLAAQMAVEDFGATGKGMKVEVISADHQNKPDVGASIARQWYDTDRVDVIVDVPTSSVALAVSEITRDKKKAFLNSGAATSALTGKDCSPNTIHWTYDTWMLANGTGSAIVKAGVYAAVLHYLKAIDAGKTDDGTKTIAKMKELPTDDPLFGKGTIRVDGRKIHPAYLFEVKKPAESKGPYDYYKLRTTIPADQAFRPLAAGNCPIAK